MACAWSNVGANCQYARVVQPVRFLKIIEGLVEDEERLPREWRQSDLELLVLFAQPRTERLEVRLVASGIHWVSRREIGGHLLGDQQRIARAKPEVGIDGTRTMLIVVIV